MELIVDGKNVLEPVNLEKNKKEIMQQRASVPTQVSLTHFKENVGIFRANVKGDDLNGLVTEMQSVFSDINSREANMYDQLDTVFKTVESIHKGSIEGIIVGVKSAQEAISQAEYAISTITDTLSILQDFKNQLEDNTEHLNDIDVIWNATQQIDEDIQRLEDSLSEKATRINENIDVLMELKLTLDKIRHIKDIDVMHKDLSNFHQTYEQEKKKTTERMEKILNDVTMLKSFKESLETIKHLEDVDKTFNILAELKDGVAAEKIKIEENNASIREEIQRLAEYKNILEKIEHIHDVDLIWDEQKSILVNVQKLSKDTKLFEDEVGKLKKELLRCDVLEKEVNIVKNKMKIMTYALGTTVGVLIIQIIMNVLGII